MVIIDYIKQIPEPRMQGKVKYSLESIIFTALCAVLSGCETWEDISLYAKEKQQWLSQFVTFKNGTPSEWTFRRIFTILSPDCMEEFLKNFARYVLSKQKSDIDHVAIDGKRLCGSQDNKGFACAFS